MTMLFPFGLPTATAFFLLLLVATLVLHMVFMHYVLAGTAYLACGRLMGPKRCAVCGWQAILIDRLPVATVLAITAGVAPLLCVQILYHQAFSTSNLLLSHRWVAILAVLIVCLSSLYVQKSTWITRRAWFWRIPVAAAAFAGIMFVAASWTENHLLSLDHAVWPRLPAERALHDATAGFWPRLGVWFFSAFATLAVELAWQGRLLGMELVQPPPGSSRVMGLSAVRRLSLTAISGCVGVAGCGLAYAVTLPLETRSVMGGPLAGPWVVAVLTGLGLQIFSWAWVAFYDRLPLPVLLAATVGCGVSVVSGVVLREALRATAIGFTALTNRHATATEIGGLPVFVMVAMADAAAIGWCIHIARRCV